MDRAEREKKVVEQMIVIYCRRHHALAEGQGLCRDCVSLRDYAFKKIDLCPKGSHKTSCRKCEIHCYAPEKKEQIRQVMRYVGPRMIFIHPISALRHLINELRR